MKSRAVIFLKILEKAVGILYNFLTIFQEVGILAAPLAQLIRPQTLDDVVGQKHLIGENMPLRNIIESGNLPNMIFYGP